MLWITTNISGRTFSLCLTRFEVLRMNVLFYSDIIYQFSRDLINSITWFIIFPGIWCTFAWYLRRGLKNTSSRKLIVEEWICDFWNPNFDICAIQGWRTTNVWSTIPVRHVFFVVWTKTFMFSLPCWQLPTSLVTKVFAGNFENSRKSIICEIHCLK